MLNDKPKIGDKVKHPEKGTCVVKSIYDEYSGKPLGTLALESEDGKHSFDAHCEDLCEVTAWQPRRKAEKIAAAEDEGSEAEGKGEYVN